MHLESLLGRYSQWMKEFHRSTAAQVKVKALSVLLKGAESTGALYLHQHLDVAAGGLL
jgi:hypothetical protein